MIPRGNRFKCYYCGQDEKCTRDHFIPSSRRTELWDMPQCIVWACAVCQKTKSAMLPLEWLKWIEKRICFNEEYKVRVNNTVHSLIEFLNKNKEFQNGLYVKKSNQSKSVIKHPLRSKHL